MGTNEVTNMAVLTQGTQVYLLVANEAFPGEKRIVEIECATTFQPGEDTADKIETTCLKAKSKSFLDGLTTPGDGSFTINADPRMSSHLLLKKLADGATADKKEPVMWAVGWSDGVDIAPMLNGNNTGWTLPNTRTWIEFKASVSAFPFDFTGNAVVATNCTINRSGDTAWYAKGGATPALPASYDVEVTDPLAFILRIGSVATSAIDATAAAADVKSAIESAVPAVTATVTGAAGSYVVAMVGATGELSALGATVTPQ